MIKQSSQDEERLRKTYNVPVSIQIMIPMSGIYDSDPPWVGWTVFYEKGLWLGVKFPLYPFIRRFLAKTQHAPD